MQFSSQEDIEAPVEQVFAILSDFDSFERSAIRRGIEVARVDGMASPESGITWNTKFTLRGKLREMRLDLVDYDPPNEMRFQAASQNLDGVLALELMALSQRRTRMSVVLELSAKTLSARLMMQSLKLARTKLNKRFRLKVAEHAKNLEDRARV